MSPAPAARTLVLAGPGLCLALMVVSGLAAERRHAARVRPPQALAEQVSAVLDGDARTRSADHDPPRRTFEDALLLRPDASLVDALPFYDEAERAAFSRSRWVGSPPSGRRGPVLAPPYALTALLASGAVSVHWVGDPATQGLAEELPAGQRLGFHVYRSLNAGEHRLVAELPGDARLFRDSDLPLARAQVSYQVWTVLLGSDGRPVAAEAADLVSLEVPERFRIVLVGGDTEAARIRVDVGPDGLVVSRHEVQVGTGQAVVVDGRPTGLVLQALMRVSSEQLETRRRLAFRSDGSLVLDPLTQTPRISETQVLVPVTRLVATLTDSTGASRTLELDIP